jgi:hypothetical protein
LREALGIVINPGNTRIVAAAWHAHPMLALFASGTFHAVELEEGRGEIVFDLTRDGLSSPSSYQM